MEGREEPFRVEYSLLGCIRSLFLTRYLRSTLNEVSGHRPKTGHPGAPALVGPQIKAQFALDNRGYGWVLAAFQLTYAFFQWPAGYLDRWNVRRTYAGAVLWWSFAGIATAFAPSLGLLMTFRALLGMGESFNWPCALRVTSGVLPPSDRSLGNGICCW